MVATSMKPVGRFRPGQMAAGHEAALEIELLFVCRRVPGRLHGLASPRRGHPQPKFFNVCFRGGGGHFLAVNGIGEKVVFVGRLAHCRCHSLQGLVGNALPV